MKRRFQALLLLGLGACVIGVRGQAAFESTHDLQGVSEVHVELPSTPVQVFACDATAPATCPEDLSVVGAWVSTGATKDDARDNASTPLLVFERLEGFGELRAEIPQDVLGLVDLQLDTLRLPGDRDLSIDTSVGDVEVIGVTASVAIDVEAGDIRVLGADEGVGVRTGEGEVTLETAGHASATVGEGSVQVVQTAGARDLYVHVHAGDIVAELADTANVRLRIEAPGKIEVRTDDLVQVTQGELVRRIGLATTEIVLVTEFGDVTVTQRP